MKTLGSCFSRCLFAVFACAALSTTLHAAGPLSSWNDTAAKKSILQFVAKVTQKGSPDFVSPEDRIAVFDNDGTLWPEQPAVFEAYFALDRVKAMAPRHPEWKDRPLFKAVLDNDRNALIASGEKGATELIMATHAGVTTDEFQGIVKEWLATAKHPRFNRPFTDLAYQPMLELLAYLCDNNFKIFIVSGGEVEFMRAWTGKVYGLPPEQVLGSSIKMKFEMRDGNPVLVRLPDFDLVAIGPGKPVGIQKFIGRRPLAAFGNSDGDLQMLQWTAGGEGPRFMLLVNHNDADREWAYDSQAAKALEEARGRDWTVVDMKKDWIKVFSFD